MYFNGSFFALETWMGKPLNYILSLDGLKESKMLQDDLQECVSEWFVFGAATPKVIWRRLKYIKARKTLKLEN